MEISRNECEQLIKQWEVIENTYPWETTDIEIRELETRLFNPELWNNPENASEINKRFTTLTKEFNKMKEAQEWAFSFVIL